MSKTRKGIVMVMLLVFFVGCILFAYPYIRGFYLDARVQDSANSFLELVKPSEKPAPSELSPTEATQEPTKETIPNQELWDAVHDYNQQSWEDRQSGLTDPWSYQQPSFTLGDFGLEDEVFAVISIPKIELEIPIYLGATDDHLSLGAAHLSQTSLPVGGSNTNCVIAGHRGWHNGKYFHDIVSLSKGDMVEITNMWETLHYRVVETKTIESYEVEKIKILPVRDMITLLTCYYTGSNHKMRFAVYCERVTEFTTERKVWDEKSLYLCSCGERSGRESM